MVLAGLESGEGGEEEGEEGEEGGEGVVEWLKPP